MIRSRIAGLAALALTFGGAPYAFARIAGGGPAATDCYAEWDGVTASGSNPVVVDCQDGDPNCDTDGTVDGKCTFAPNVCIQQTDVTGCTPVAAGLTKLLPVKALLKTSKFVTVALVPPSSLTAAACGTAAQIEIPAPKRGNGAVTKAYSLKAVTGAKGKLKTDKDRLVLKCRRNVSAGKCPSNPAGGPNEFRFDINSEGDLDNGWTGNSHNNPNVVGTITRVCLKDCNMQSSPACTEDETTTNGVNGRTFGAPLPLIASNVPVCVVNRYDKQKVTGGVINFATGDLAVTVNLLSDVVITQTPNICPVCSGQNLGDKGTCDATSTRAGGSCTVDGIITVGALNKRFTLSSSCPPRGVPAGTLTIPLALTTGVSSKTGAKPCGESQDDACAAAGPCTAVGDTTDSMHAHCSGATTCPKTDANGQCIDSRGGISQFCCAGNLNQSCQPTAAASGVGSIDRAGSKTVPTPAVPDPTFPKCATATLASVFCEAATTSNLVNTVTGLPGPGADILPVKWQVKLESTTSDCP